MTIETLESRECLAAYSIVDLLPPAGAATSIALALNDEGLVVGRTDVAGYGRATAWKVSAGPTATGTLLPALGTGDLSDARDVNNSGMIAGYSTDSPAASGGVSHAAVWSKTDTGYVLHDLAGSAPGSEANALSEPDPHGVTWVVGFAGDHATVWRVGTDGNVLSTIDLEPTSNPSRAHDVRLVDPDSSPESVGDEYVLVSGEVQLSNRQPAVVWRLDLDGNGDVEGAVRTDLDTLGGPAGWGQALNGSGHVAGQSSLSTKGPWYAFINKDGTTTSLGSLTNGSSRAEGLNDSDIVVGQCDMVSKSGAVQGFKAFVWQNGTMLELRKQLGTKDQSTWSTLFGAYDVNTAGQIVGNGAVGKGSSAKGHGFLMTPPALHASSEGPGMAAAAPTADQLEGLFAEAASRWSAAGFDTSSLGSIDIRIADLGGTMLGVASGNTIWLDDNAAGWGWFIDATPSDDSEFVQPCNQGEQNLIDLLTVVMHELGHLLGRDHDGDGVMSETLAAGVRHTELQNHLASLNEMVGQTSDLRDDSWLTAWLSAQLDSNHMRARRLA